ncbi:MAG: c-type cytochrome [Granulosicoccaceae bacterium]
MTENANDSGMVRMMIIVMGALVLFTLLCVTMARLFGIADGDGGDPLMRNALIERIQPVGVVRTVLEAPAAAATAEVAAVEMSVEELYNGACVACHGNPGLPNAPKVGDDAWASREGGDIAALTTSAIEGKGQMPARGASTYTDDQIRRVVEYLVGK